MNYDIAIEIGKRAASEYAEKHQQPVKAFVESAYFAGYMQNVAEREALRAIVKRIEGTTKAISKKADSPIVQVAIPPVIEDYGDFT